MRERLLLAMLRFFASITIAAALAGTAGFSTAQTRDIDWYRNRAPFQLPAVPEPKFPDRRVDITAFGAKPDGETLNTDAFEKAITACAKSGGGTVVVPAGLWFTGPIRLQSNINLHLEHGALIKFSGDHRLYPMLPMTTSGNYFQPAPPIHGYDLKNVAITGQGVIDGAGDSWRPVKKAKVTAAEWKKLNAKGVVSADGAIWWPSQAAMEGEARLKAIRASGARDTAAFVEVREFLRPYMVYLFNCENVLIQGVTLRNSPKFVLYPSHCSNVTIREANIFNEDFAQNGDGIDISASRNVVVYNCNVSVGDDGICMKSSAKNPKPGSAALENVLVAGCRVYHGHGGFVIGSNTDGNMRNIYVEDCSFIGTDIGIRVKSAIGRGGLVERVAIRNISMSDIVNEAILFDTYYEDVAAGQTAKGAATTGAKIPEFRNFDISKVYCRGAKTGIRLRGLPQMPVHEIRLEDITITAQHAIEEVAARDNSFKNVRIITPGGTRSW